MISEGEKESVSICYGIFYGNMISMKSLEFFVNYNHKLGVERIVAYLHPTLNQSHYLPLYREIGLEISMWDSNYTVQKIPHHLNHRRAIEQCILTEINQFNATTIIVCDPDEFLYFNLEKYSSLQSFLADFRQKKTVGQLFLSRWYYEIDLCLREHPDDRTIWDSPYIGRTVGSVGKSIFFTDNFVSVPETKFEHHFNVTGETVEIESTTAHFKHFRRFLTWDGACHVAHATKIKHREKRDTSDPSHKSYFNAHEYFFRRDTNLLSWRNFIEGEDKKDVESRKKVNPQLDRRPFRRRKKTNIAH